MARRLEYFGIGCIVGVAAGIILGLLLAPFSGDEMRHRVAQRTRRVVEVARDVADRAEVGAGALGERVDHYLGRDEEVAWRKVREIREGVERYTHAQTP
jgi:gas vesicle protein